MAKPLVSDSLWAGVAPLLPHCPANPRSPGRQWPDGIVFVLETGIQWEYLPREMGSGSGDLFNCPTAARRAVRSRTGG